MSVTYFVAMPFARLEEDDLVAGEAKECPSAIDAEAAARRFAPDHAGAIAFSRAGDPNVGEFEDAKILLLIGEVLTIEQLLDAASM